MHVKTGRPGPKPDITRITWEGSAEVHLYYVARVPAALADTDRGQMAIVRLFGSLHEGPQWWDARLVCCREWETSDAREVLPRTAAAITAVLATANDKHEFAKRDIIERIRQGILWLTDPNQ